MGLFNFWKREDSTAQPTAEPIYNPTNNVNDVLLRALLNNETIDREKAMTLPAVSGAVDLISGTIASMPVKLYKYKQGKVEEVENDTRVKILNGDTGDTLDAYQLKKAMTTDFLLGRGGYAYIERHRNEVTGLYYVEDIYITILRNYKPIYKDYVILVEGQQYKPYDFVKLLRNTKDGASGKGLTEEVSKALETAYNTLIYQLGMVKSGGNKKGFIKSQKKLDQNAIDTLKAAWQNLYANNEENVVVLNNGLEFQEASNNSVEMQLNESKKTLQDEINNIFHIYPNDFWRTFKEAIYPIIRAFTTALNRDLLLEKEKKNYFFEFDVKEIIKANITERYNAYKTAKETGFMTINEIRRAENMNYVEGLDVVNVGLGAVLFDVNTGTYYTPNIDATMDPQQTDESIQNLIMNKELDTAFEESGNSAERAEQERFNPNHDPKNGQFATGHGGSGGGAGGSGASESSKSDSATDNSPRAKRGQIDTGYNSMIPSSDLEAYNAKALDSIKKDTGMSDKDAKIFQKDLQEYLGGDYEGYVAGKYPDKVKVIDEGLAKMPAYDGTVYRGMHLDENGIEAYANLKSGDTIKMKSVSSWSSKESVAKNYGADYNPESTVVFEAANKSGVGVQHISKWGTQEAEVLAPSTASWKVQKTEVQTKYDYLKAQYTEQIAKATIPPKKKMAQKNLDDLEANKEKYQKAKYVRVILEEG